MSSPIGFLAGVWHGTGTGDYPTMPPFRYAEEVRFIPLLESVLMYQQTAWSADDGEVLHFESGIWRSTDTGDLAVTISLPRVAEVAEGRIEAGRILLEATSLGRAAGGAPLIAVRREYVHHEGEITYARRWRPRPSPSRPPISRACCGASRTLRPWR